MLLAAINTLALCGYSHCHGQYKRILLVLVHTVHFIAIIMATNVLHMATTESTLAKVLASYM